MLSHDVFVHLLVLNLCTSHVQRHVRKRPCAVATVGCVCFRLFYVLAEESLPLWAKPRRKEPARVLESGCVSWFGWLELNALGNSTIAPEPSWSERTGLPNEDAPM